MRARRMFDGISLGPPIQLNVEYTLNGDDRLNWLLSVPTFVDAFTIDPFHHSRTEVIPFAGSWSAGIQHASTLPNVEEEVEARGAMLEAFLYCRYTAFAVSYYRETVWAAMAPFVYQDAWGEDAFQKGMLAIWEELPKWATDCPVKYKEQPPDAPFHVILDDVIRYLRGVSKNGMLGRQRKPTVFDSTLVVHTPDLRQAEYDVPTEIEELTDDPTERQMLQLKTEGLSEKQIGVALGLSRSQVNRRIKKLYDKCRERYGVSKKPMGRAPRKTG